MAMDETNLAMGQTRLAMDKGTVSELSEVQILNFETCHIL